MVNEAKQAAKVWKHNRDILDNRLDPDARVFVCEMSKKTAVREKKILLSRQLVI